MLRLLSEEGGGTAAGRGAGGTGGTGGAGGTGGEVEALPPALGAAGVRAGLQDLERLGLVQTVQDPQRLGRAAVEVAPPAASPAEQPAARAAEAVLAAEDQLAATRVLPPMELASALRRYWGTLLPTAGGLGGAGLPPQGGSSEARDWDASEFSGVDV